MNLAISEIRKRPEGIDFSQHLDIKEKMLERDPSILDIKDVVVTGNVSYDDGLYILTYRLNATVVLPSSRSMEAVDSPLTEDISELFIPAADAADKSDLVEENLALVLEDDRIDLEESVIDNILLSIPMQVLTEDERASDALPSGSHWSVLTEEQFNVLQREKKQENSPFMALDGLFGD